MKKIILIILFSFLFASNLIYIGESKGKVIAGITTLIDYHQTRVGADVRLIDIHTNDTKGFAHKKVKYDFELRHRGVYYHHTSIHGIDLYNGVEIKDTIGMELTFDLLNLKE